MAKQKMAKKKEVKRIYPEDTLTAQERFEAVIRLEEPDRVPLSFWIYNFAPLFTGEKMSRYMADPAIYMNVMHQVWEELGPWDIYYNLSPFSRMLYSFAMMMKTLWPGIELEEGVILKADETPYMNLEDYDKILKSPRFMADFLFRSRMLSRFCQEVQGWGMMKLSAKMMKDSYQQVRFLKKDFNWWRQRGAVVQGGYQAEVPFDSISFGRNVTHFSRDLFKIPQKINKAAEHLSHSFANQAVNFSKMIGMSTIHCVFHRSSNHFISPRQFEEMSLPSIEIIVQRILESGITPVLHCDGNWTLNLKYLRKFPARKIIIQFDGDTDIFRAKEEIGDRMCIYGDVPAHMLAAGTPAEVEEYCHRLIEEVGKGGGFILASGCEVPPNAKMENLRAMVRSVKKYGYYKKGKPQNTAS